MSGSIFKALGVLLTYPEPPLVDASPTIAALLARELEPSSGDLDGLTQLTSELSSRSLLALQERYVETFDGSRQTSLHLFEHVHGDARDRGQALVDLAQLYQRRAGLRIDAAELPDFLPLFCEFLSTLPREEALDHLKDAAPVIGLIGRALTRRGSPYAAVLHALARLAGERAEGFSHGQGEDTWSAAEGAGDLEALDEQWREAPVRFDAGGALAGPSPGGCGSAGTLVPLRKKETRLS